MKKNLNLKKSKKTKQKTKKEKQKIKNFSFFSLKKQKKKQKMEKKIWKKNYFVKIIKALKLMYLPSPDELNFLKKYYFFLFHFKYVTMYLSLYL